MKLNRCPTCGHEWASRRLCACVAEPVDVELRCPTAYLITSLQDGNIPHHAVTLDKTQADGAEKRGAMLQMLEVKS